MALFSTTPTVLDRFPRLRRRIGPTIAWRAHARAATGRVFRRAAPCLSASAKRRSLNTQSGGVAARLQRIGQADAISQRGDAVAGLTKLAASSLNAGRPQIWSVSAALPVAVFDLAHVTGPITVTRARGDERVTPLGEAEVEHPAPGEVIFVDEAGLVSARRWCWRQSEQSAARETTRDALITVEAHHERAGEDVHAALDDLQALLREYQPQAICDAAILTRDAPVFAP